MVLLVLATFYTAQAVGAPPAVTEVAPVTASNTGGDEVVILGDGFQAGASVKFGLAESQQVVVHSSSRLSVTVPPSNQAGRVDVVVMNTDGQRGTLVRGFTYLRPGPSVDSVSPKSGLDEGGESVTLNGSGFYNDLVFTQIVAGATHACGISSGKVYCWGDNQRGQLGDATATQRSVPTRVQTDGVLAGKTIAAVAVGSYFTVAIDSDGRAYGWGDNDYGQLGDGTTVSKNSPVAVATNGVLAGKAIAAISAGSNFTIAADSAGKVYSWGVNSQGTLGNNSQAHSSTPVSVVDTGVLAGKVIRQLAAGQNFVTVLDDAGRAYSWGYNAFGQLGNKTTSSSLVPVAVNASGVLSGKVLRSISSGGSHVLASDEAGATYSWGGNTYGQLGNGSVANSSSPSKVMGSGALNGKSVRGVAAAADHSLAIDSNGRAYGWGRNNFAQLGYGSTNPQSFTYPVNTVGYTPTKFRIHVGDSEAVVTAQSESKLTFTAPAHSPGTVDIVIASDETELVTLPRAYEYQSPVHLVSVAPISGSVHGGDVVVVNGEGFTNETKVMFNDIELATTFISTTSLSAVVPAAMSSGDVNVRVINGSRTSNVLSRAYRYVVPTPSVRDIVPAFGPSQGGTDGSVNGSGFHAGVKFVATNTNDTGMASHSCGITEQGGVYCWGLNTLGQLGNGSNTNSSVPVKVSTDGAISGKRIVAVSVGTSHTVALDDNGAVYAWGAGGEGRLGNGAIKSHNTPIAVSTTGVLAGKKIIAIGAGNNQSYALDDEGRVYSWGGNTNGSLGDGTTTNRYSPVAVNITGVLAGKKVVALSPGSDFVIALDSAGDLFAWGGNGAGRLGDNSTQNRFTPVAVYKGGVLAGKRIVAVDSGQDHSVALDAEGKVYTWGGNANGQLGSGAFAASQVPLAVSGGGLQTKVITSVSAGAMYTLVTDAEGELYGWGQNVYGSLGNGLTTPESPYGVAVPARANIYQPIRSFNANKGTTCFASYDGNIYCFGDGAQGEIGNGVSATQLSPAMISRANVTNESVIDGVMFGGKPASIIGTTNTSVVLNTPAHEPGTVDVTLNSGHFDPVVLKGAFTYMAPPTITSVSPSEGTVTGGDAVTIKGSHFENGAAVLFGNVAAASVTYIDATTLVATTPAHYAGPKDVTVVNTDTQRARLRSAYAFRTEAPRITSVAPSAVSMAGGAEVVIDGEGFNARYQQAVTVSNDTGVAVESGRVDIRLDTAALVVAGKMRSDGGDIRFHDAAGKSLDYRIVSGMNTASTRLVVSVAGLAPGSSTIYLSYNTPSMTSESNEVIDSNTTAGLSVTLGDEEAVSGVYVGSTKTVVTHITPTRITLVAPPHEPGTASLSVHGPYSDMATKPGALTYLPATYSFTSEPLNVATKEAGLLKVEARDENGIPVISTHDIILSLSTTSAAGGFAPNLDTQNTWDASTITIPAGKSGAEVYYRDNAQGSPTVTVVDEAGTRVSQQQTIGPRYKLRVTGVSDPIQAGVPSSVTVQAVDIGGVPQADYTGTVRFTSSDPRAKLVGEYTFTTDHRGRFTFVNAVTMMTVGEHCLRVTDVAHASVTGQQCDITINPAGEGVPSRLKIITPEQSFPLTRYSSPITIQTQDATGGSAVALSDAPLYLHSSSPSGQFSADGVNWANTPFITNVESGTSSRNVYYRDTTTGTFTLTVRDEAGVGDDTGWENTEQYVTVGVGEAVSLRMSGPDNGGTAGTWIPVRVGLADRAGNAVSAKYDTPIRVSVDSASARLSNSDLGSSAATSIEATIGTGSQYATVYVRDSVDHEVILQATDSSPPENTLDAAELRLAIRPAPPIRVAFMPVSDARVYQPIEAHAYLQDEFGNTVIPESSYDIAFNSSSSSGGFAATGGGPWSRPYETKIEAGATTRGVFYRDTNVGESTLSAHIPGLIAAETSISVAPQIYNPAAGGTLSFTTPPRDATTDEQQAVVVTLRDDHGKTALAGAPVTVRFLTSAGGEYASGAGVWDTTIDVIIPAGESTATATYRNTVAGGARLYAHDVAQVSTQIQRDITVSPGAPADFVYTSPPRMVAKNGVSDAISIGLHDAYGNETVAGEAFEARISSTSPTGEFSLDGVNGWSSTISVPYAKGSADAIVYYRDSAVGVHDVTIANDAMRAASQSVRVVEGFVHHISLSAPTGAGVGVGVPVTVSTHMADGTEVGVVGDVTLELRADGEFSLTEEPFRPITSVLFVEGESRKQLYYRSDTMGVQRLRADESPSKGWAAGEVDIAFTAGAFHALTYAASPASVPVHESSDAFSVSMIDMYGNVTTTSNDTTGYLYTSSTTGSFAHSAGGPWGADSVQIPAGDTTQQFYYKDDTLGIVPTVTVSDSSRLDEPDTGVVNATVSLTIVGQIAQKMGFISPVRTVVAGELSDSITIQAQKADGSPAVQGAPLRVYLSSETGDRFYATSDTTKAIESIEIPTGESSVSLHIRASKAGVRTIRAYGPAEGSQNVTVTPGDPAAVEFTTASQSVIAGQASAQISVQLRDAYANTVYASKDYAVELASSCVDGQFSSTNDGPWSSVGSVSVAAGESSGIFYYHSTVAGNCVITAGGGSLEAAEQTITIRSGQGVRLGLSVPAQFEAGQTVSVVATLLDTYGNVTTNAGAYRMLYFDSTADSGSFGSPSVYLPTGASSATVPYRDTTPGNPRITVRDQVATTDEGWIDGAVDAAVTRGEAKSLAFAPDAINLVAGEAGKLTLELRNAYGALYQADTPIIVYLSSDVPGGYFTASPDTGQDGSVDSITLPAGSSSVIVYYAQGSATPANLRASVALDGVVGADSVQNASATAQVISASISEIAITSPAPNAEVNELSPITVQARDVYGNATVFTDDTTLYLSSTSFGGRFKAMPGGGDVTTITVPGGASSVTFYYKDTNAGQATITVSDQLLANEPVGIGNATQVITTRTAIPGKLAIVDAPSTLDRGQVSGALRVEVQSNYGMPAMSESDRKVYLGDARLSGEFALSPNGPWGISELTIPAGETGVEFYYRNMTQAGATELVASDVSSPAESPDVGLKNAQHELSVRYGNFAQLRFETAPSTQTARHPSSEIRLKAYNRYGLETAVADPTYIYLRSTQSRAEFSSDRQTWGITRILLLPDDSGASVSSFYYRDPEAGEPTITASTGRASDAEAVSAAQRQTIILQEHEGFEVMNVSDPQYLGTPSSVVVSAVDDAGYVVDWYAGTVTFSSSDRKTILPEPYTYVPAKDRGTHTFTNGVAFTSSGEKAITVTDQNGKSGAQHSITVLGAATSSLNKLVFIEPKSTFISTPDRVSPLMTIQAQDAADNAYVPKTASMPIMLRSTSATGEFALSTAGPWRREHVVSIPTGLSFVNFYYRDAHGIKASITGADWVGAVDTAAIQNAVFAVLGGDESLPEVSAPSEPTPSPMPTEPMPPRLPATPGDTEPSGPPPPSGGTQRPSTDRPSATPDTYQPQAALAKLLPRTVVDLLRAPATPYVFPAVLLALIGVLVVILLRQVYAEIRRARVIRAILAKEAQTARDKSEFLTTAAHYLRTPIAIIGGAANMLRGTGVDPVVADGVAAVSQDLRNKSEEILARTEQHEALRPISTERVAVTHSSIYYSPLFWLPVVAMIVMSLLMSWTISQVGGVLGAAAYLEQVLLIVLGAVILYAVLRERYVHKERRSMLESAEMHRAQLDRVKNDFVTETYEKLSADVVRLIGFKNQLHADNSATTIMDDGSRRLLSLIAKFETLARIDSLRVHPSVFASEELIDVAVEPLKQSAASKQVNIATSAPRLLLQQDEKLVSSVLRSVVENAITFSPDGSDVVVAAQPVDDVLVITVADQGPGFSRDPAELLGLFERGEAAESVEHEGMGLSLYLNKIIMDNLGGTIEARNRSDQGAEVTLRVPLRAA